MSGENDKPVDVNMKWIREVIKAVPEDQFISMLVNRLLKDKNGWMPIDTAPKDGTNVLIWEPSRLHTVARWNGKAWDDGDFFSNLDATHWQPLPQNPEPEA